MCQVLKVRFAWWKRPLLEPRKEEQQEGFMLNGVALNLEMLSHLNDMFVQAQRNREVSIARALQYPDALPSSPRTGLRLHWVCAMHVARSTVDEAERWWLGGGQPYKPPPISRHANSH